MTKSVVQQTAGKTDFLVASASVSLSAFGSATTSGNSIYVFVTGFYDGSTGFDVSSIADSAGNSYAEVVDSGVDQLNGRAKAVIWAAHNITGHAANIVTVTLAAATSHFFVGQAIEVSAGGVQSTDKTGVDTDAYDDQSLTVTASGANTDAAAIALAIVGGFNGANNPVPSLPSGYTDLYSYQPGAGTYRPYARFCYKICAGAETSAFTSTVSTTQIALVGAIATFQEPNTTKYLRLTTISTAASATGVEGWVIGDDNTTYYGKFTAQAFDATLTAGSEAVLYVPIADISPDGDTLTTSDTPQVVVRNTTYGTTMCDATVIEE